MTASGDESFTEVHPGDGGRWLVQTETASYLLDLDEGTVRRHPAAGAGAVPGAGPVRVADLRRDGEVIALVDLLTCRVGERMGLLLDLGLPAPEGDTVLTLRLATFVRSITRL